MKITNWFKVKENIDKRNKNKEEEENNTIENLCSFNYTSSIKERVFSRNPNLVLKIFDKEKNKENIQEPKIIKNIEKISENDEVNEIYNCLISDNNNKENINENKEKEKENKSENEQGKSLHGSSIMNIFINPNITISSNNCLGNKTEREGK